MALEINALANDIAAHLSSTFSEENTEERQKFAKTLAEVIINHLKTHAEIVIPVHHPKMTGPSPVFRGVTGGGQAFIVAPHRHLITATAHEIGKIR